MNCKECLDLISLYVDGLLVGKEADEVKKHIENCEECREEYETLMIIKESLNDIEMVELPENFNEELHERLVVESQTKKTPSFDFSKINFKKINKKVSFGVVAAVVMIGVLVGPLSNMNKYDYEDAVYETKAAAPMSMKAEADFGSVEAFNAVDAPEVRVTFDEAAIDVGAANDTATYSLKSGKSPARESSRKIIKYGNLSVRVLDFDMTIEDIEKKVTSVGGYVENYYSEISEYDEYNPEDSLKYGNINVRIPKDKFDSIFGGFGQLGIVQNSNVYTSDVTDNYRDTEASLKNLESREEALREIMKKAVEIKDVIEVERELARVRTEIDQQTGRLKNWDNKVEYSSLSIEIIEVRELKKVINPVDKTLWEKSMDGLRNTINNLINMVEELVIFIVSYIPIIAVITVIGIVLLISRRKKNEK